MKDGEVSLHVTEVDGVVVVSDSEQTCQIYQNYYSETYKLGSVRHTTGELLFTFV